MAHLIRYQLLAGAVFLVAGCAGEREPPTQPVNQAAAIDVPAPPPVAERATEPGKAAPGPPPARSERAERDPGSAELDFEVRHEGETTHFSAGDGGVRAWGSFTRTDGGFSFRGGFSASTPGADAGP